MDRHETAVVHARALVAASVKIGPCAVIESDVEIGGRSEIGAHACVKRFTCLGADNIVHEGAVLGGEPQDVSYAECESFLRIGERNRLREHVTLHRGTQPGSETRVGSDCFIMAGAHLAHNCKVGDRVIMANHVALAGYVEVGDGAFIAGGAMVHQFTRIGRLAMVGGMSKIVQDCLPFSITDGRPARACGLNVVGLRRAGFASNKIRVLKQAYRILLRSNLSLESAIDQMNELQDPTVNELVEFVRDTKRGFCH